MINDSIYFLASQPCQATINSDGRVASLLVDGALYSHIKRTVALTLRTFAIQFMHYILGFYGTI